MVQRIKAELSSKKGDFRTAPSRLAEIDPLKMRFSKMRFSSRGRRLYSSYPNETALSPSALSIRAMFASRPIP
jgi:hypothetical protein